MSLVNSQGMFAHDGTEPKYNSICSNPVLVTATLSCLGPLIRSRPSIAGKIVSSILNFNPFKQPDPHMGPKFKVQVKSMERTVRMLLLNILRR